MRIFIFIVYSALLVTACQKKTEIPADYQQLLNEITEVKPKLVSGDFDKAEAQLRDILSRTKDKGYHYLSAKIYTYLGYIFDEQRLLKKSYVTYNEALKYWNSTDTPSVKNILVCYNNLGGICDDHKEYEQAIYYYQKALEFKDDISPVDLADLYYNLGTAYRQDLSKGDINKAEKFFLKSLEVARRSEYDNGIAAVFYIIGVMYSDLEDYEVANLSFRESISYSEEKGLDEFQECSYHALGHNYLLNQKYDKALEYLKKATKYEVDESVVFEIYTDLGATYKELGMNTQAIESWNNALVKSEYNRKDDQARIYKRISNTYQEMGELDRALTYSQLHNRALAEMISSKNFTKGDYDQILFKDVIANYEQFQHQETFEHKLRYTYIPAGVAFLVILLISIAIYRYQLSNNKKDRAEKIKSFQVD